MEAISLTSAGFRAKITGLTRSALKILTTFRYNYPNLKTALKKRAVKNVHGQTIRTGYSCVLPLLTTKQTKASF